MPAKKKDAAASTDEASAPTTLWDLVGLDPNEMGRFFRPEGRRKRLRVLAVRPPAEDERVKELPVDENGKARGKVTVLAIVDGEEQGVPCSWEVTAKGAIHALAAALGAPVVLPADVTIRTIGKGTSTTYEIRAVDDDQDDDQALGDDGTCMAPSCALDAGHAGQHRTEAWLRGQTAQKGLVGA